jgi:hypothetical protein
MPYHLDATAHMGFSLAPILVKVLAE